MTPKLALVVLVVFCGALLRPALVQGGPKADEFAQMNAEWSALIGKLTKLKAEYASSTDAVQKAEIRKQYNEGIVKGRAMEERLVEAAKHAYLEAPNVNATITSLLVAELADRNNRGDYAHAYPLGKLLTDNNCPDPRAAKLAGIAAANRPRADGELSSPQAQVASEQPTSRVQTGPYRQARGADTTSGGTDEAGRSRESFYPTYVNKRRCVRSCATSKQDFSR